MPTYTQAQLVREVVKKLFPRDIVDAAVAVNADTSATVVTLAELRSNRGSPDTYAGGWLYVYAGTNLGQARRVELYEPVKGATYGAVDLARPLTAAPDGTTQVLLYNGGRSPDEVKLDINTALRRTWRQRDLPLGLLSDGLMELADTSAWTASNATLTKVSDAASVFEGANALRVVNSAPNGYAQSEAIPVADQVPIRLEGVVKINNAPNVTVTATLQLVNVTTGAVLAQVTSTSRDRAILSLSASVPAGTGTVAVRLLGVQAAADIVWDDVLLWRPWDTTVVLPVDITAKAQIIDVFRRYTQGAQVGSAASAVATPYNVDMLRVGGYQVGPDPAVLGRIALAVPRGGSNTLPLVVRALVPIADLATDTSAVVLPNLPDLLAKVQAITYDALAREGAHDDRSWYDKQAQRSRPGAMRASAMGPRAPRNALR